MKPFTAFEKYVDSDGGEYRKFVVSGKRQYCATDVYCVIKFAGVRLEDKVGLGTVEQYLGDVGDLTAEKEYLKMVCVITWANDRKFVGYLEDIYKDQRKNLDDCPDIYSVDPVGCIDIDDALCVKYNSTEGVYDVAVHIADVSCYIPDRSSLDEELSYRGESVYLKSFQGMMIPKKLVGCYSLTAGTAKNVFSVFAVFNQDYKLISVNFQRSRIIVKENLSYEAAWEKINMRDDTSLILVYDFGRKLREILGLNSDGVAYDTHLMVEAYMVFANTLVARQLAEVNAENVLLRRHKGAKRELYKNDTKDLELIKKANILLMNKAEYCIGVSEDSKHIGLGCDLYTHFTSPIRRYADILVHRMLTNVNYKTDEKTILQLNMQHCKYNKCERLAEQLEKIFHMKAQHGDVFDMDGYIVDIINTGKKLRVKIYLGDLTVNSTIFGEKLSHLVKIEEDKNKLIVHGLKHSVTLSMFQKVKIKIAITTTTQQKMIIKIIDPNLDFIFCDS